MKKLKSAVLVVLFLLGSVFASIDSLRSAVYDNSVYQTVSAKNFIYTATNGGIEIFTKDGSNFPGESTPWKVYTSLNSALPHNFVRSIAVDSSGITYVTGEHWCGYFMGKAFYDIPVQDAEDVVIGKDNIPWMIMTKNNQHGLYRNGGMGWEIQLLPAQIPLADVSMGFCHIAIGNFGKGKDSVFQTLWGTCPTGIYSYDAISGTCNVWRVGKELIAGAPLNISVWGDTVVASGETGIYVFLNGASSSPIVIAYPPETPANMGPPSMPRNNLGSVAYLKGMFYVGQRDGQLYSCTMTSPFYLTYGNGVGDDRVATNCLVTDGQKLYWGTDWNMYIYPSSNGKPLVATAVTGIHYPHDNNIRIIVPDDSNRVLVAADNGGYCYEINANSPSLNSSAQNVSNHVVTYFVDRYGVEWIGRLGSFERKTKDGQSQIFDGGAAHEMFHQPYWFVGDAVGDVVLVTSSNNCVWTYVKGEWRCKNDQPARLSKEKILSVNSSGKHLFLATDNGIYFYDFVSIWATQPLSYSTNRKICGDESLGCKAWIAEGSVLYTANGENVALHGACPWNNRIINDVFIDQDNLWIATDSGAIHMKMSGTVVPVPVDRLADKFVNTIRVVYANGERQIWFGTAGGITVWHQAMATEVKPALKSATKKAPLLSEKDAIYIDLQGRTMAPTNINNSARGKIIFQKVGGAIKIMNLNLIRQIR